MRRNEIVARVSIGAASGLAASWVMDRFQASLRSLVSHGRNRKEEERSEPATVRAANLVAKAAIGEPVPEPDRPTAGTLVHYAFGTILGGLYAILAPSLPQVRKGFGAAFGTATWLAADELMVPVAGLSPPAWKVSLSKHLNGLASHLVFSVSLEAARRLAIHRRLKQAP